MQKSQSVACFLVLADPYTPEAMHPTRGAPHAPPPGFATRLLLEHLGFFPACMDMDGEAKRLQEVPDLGIVIAFIQAQPLRRVGGRVWPLHGKACDGFAGHVAIMAMRAVHRETNRHPAAVGTDAACGAARATVRGVLAHLSPPQGALWSSRRPSRATPTQCRAGHHGPPHLVPIRLRRRLPRPTLASDDGPNDWHRSLSRVTHATGIPCGARKRWPPSRCDHRHEVDGIPEDGVCALGATAQCAPTRDQRCASHGGWSRGHQASVQLLEENSFS